MAAIADSRHGLTPGGQSIKPMPPRIDIPRGTQRDSGGSFTLLCEGGVVNSIGTHIQKACSSHFRTFEASEAPIKTQSSTGAPDQ